jgi:hypothetical protein
MFHIPTIDPGVWEVSLNESLPPFEIGVVASRDGQRTQYPFEKKMTASM